MYRPPQWFAIIVALVLLAACGGDPPATPAPPEVQPDPVNVALGLETGAGAPPSRLLIPSIDLDTTVVPVGWRIVQEGDTRRTEWEAPSFAAGHHLNSANVGERGNVVLSGHHNTEGAVFREIAQLKVQVGDEIILIGEDDQPFTYVVTEVTDPPLPELGQDEEARLQNGRYMAQTDEPTLTLITCWPLWTNTHRVVVVASLVETDS